MATNHGVWLWSMWGRSVKTGPGSYLVNPETLRLVPMPHGPLDDIDPQIIWTGHAEITLNGGGEIGPPENVRRGDPAIWNPRLANGPAGPELPSSSVTRQRYGEATGSMRSLKKAPSSPTKAGRWRTSPTLSRTSSTTAAGSYGP